MPPLQTLMCVFLTSLLPGLFCGTLAAQGDGLPPGEPGLHLRGVGRAMHGRMHSDGWLNLNVAVANSADRDLPVRIVAHLPAVPGLQAARVATIPAKTSQQLPLAMYIPSTILPDTMNDVEVSLYRMAEGDSGEGGGWNEELWTIAGMPQRSSLALSAQPSKGKMVTRLQAEPPVRFPWQWPLRAPYYDYELAVASRVRAGGDRSMIGMEGASLPLSRVDWEDVGLLMVSEATIFEDAATVVALQQFVHEGGRLWLMLEQIPADLILPLLGNAQSLAEIDRVELNRYDLELHFPLPDPRDRIVAVDRDDSVSFARLVQTGGRVTHSIDGWPAVIWMKVGYGDVILSALSSAAWLIPGSESTESLLATNYRTTMAAGLMAADVHAKRVGPPVQTPVSYPLELIGNPVLSRGWVATVLLSFLGLLTSAGLISLWRGRLGRLGWLAPVLAMSVGGVLIISAAWMRRDIPETQAVLQLIRVSELGDTALVREQGVIYMENQRAMALESQRDGFALASAGVQTGIVQFQMRGHESWQLRNMAWPTGSWRYYAQHAMDTEDLVAIGELNADGLRLILPERVRDLQDPIISYAPGQPMLGRPQPGAVLADGSVMATADRWVADAMITDEQRRRIDVYQQFFAGEGERLPPLHALVGWTAVWPEVQSDVGEMNRAGGALISLPIRLQRPESDVALYIPAGMVRLVKNLSDIGQAPAYDEPSGIWARELSLGSRMGLQFVLPAEVVPFRADSVDLVLSIRAPQRVVRLLARVHDGVGGPEEIEVARLDSPSLPWQGTITDPRILASVEDGRLDVVLEVSQRTDVESEEGASSFVAWRVDSFRAALRGARLSTDGTR
jgi:hypothetical protein